MQFIGVFSFLLLAFSLVFSACGNNPPCDLVCEEDFSCLITDGTPTCVANGRQDDDGGGTGQIGTGCDSTADCDTGLTCQAGVDGVLTCQPG